MAQKYKVTGPLKVFGKSKGEEFTRALDPAKEARLISAGHIKRVLTDENKKEAS